MIDVSKALSITGWTSQKELEWLATQASKRTNILEIGSWMGRSAVAMATNTRGIVVAVDTWKGTLEDGHQSFLKDFPDNWLRQQFLENTKTFSNITSIQGKSIDVSKNFLAPIFDMIFIDGDHSYESVKADIGTWRPLLVKGGLLCGHDYDGGRPGVVKAVRELIPRVRMAGAGSIWMEEK